MRMTGSQRDKVRERDGQISVNEHFILRYTDMRKKRVFGIIYIQYQVINKNFLSLMF